jgi:hypothetical protein
MNQYVWLTVIWSPIVETPVTVIYIARGVEILRSGALPVSYPVSNSGEWQLELKLGTCFYLFETKRILGALPPRL